MSAQSHPVLRGLPRPVRPLRRPAPEPGPGKGLSLQQAAGRAGGGTPRSRRGPAAGDAALPASASRATGTHRLPPPMDPATRLCPAPRLPPAGGLSLPAPNMAPWGKQPLRSPAARCLRTRTQDGRRHRPGPQPEAKMAASSFTIRGAAGIPVRIQDGSARWREAGWGSHVTRGGGVWTVSRRKREGPSREQGLAAAGAGWRRRSRRAAGRETRLSPRSPPALTRRPPPLRGPGAPGTSRPRCPRPRRGCRAGR